MSDKRVTVWVQAFKDRPALMLQWIDPDTGRRRSESARTNDPKEAEQKASDKSYELSHGLHVEPSKMTWERFREIYTDEKAASGADNSASKASYVFDSFERITRIKKLSQITERTISKYSTGLREEGKKPATIKGYLAYIKAALRWALNQGFLRSVPRIVMPNVPKGSNRAKVRIAARITTEEYERLDAACPNDGWRLLVGFAWHCGMRRCEAMRVKGEHVDLAGHIIRIPTNKANDEDGAAIIPPELDAKLRAMFPKSVPVGKIIKEVPADPRKVSNVFRKTIATKATVKGNGKTGFCTLHDLRRNYGSRWTVKVPAQVLQRMMRHANISTTMDYYADAEKAAMGAIWGNEPPETAR